jgi:hypothetical protein
VAYLLAWSLIVHYEVKRWIKSEPADIVEMPLWNAEGLTYALFPAAPLIIRAETPHSVYARVNQFHRRWWAINLKAAIWAESVVARRAKRVIAISEAIAHTIMTDYKVPLHQISISYLGIPSTHHHTLPNDRQPQPPQLQHDTPSLTYLFVGRLEERKGIRYLLDAIPLVVEALPHARFIIAGQDGLIPGLRQTHTEYFLSRANSAAKAATQMVGFVNDAARNRLYQACDVFVAPSLYESFGLVHLEAMAYGKPVIACRTGATPELVEDRATGILVPAQNASALADALITVGRDTALRLRMGESGRQRMQQFFSVETMVQQTLKIYEDVLAQP